MTTVEKTREFYEAAYLQLYLEERGKRVIYVDEFHVSMKSNAIYNWSPSGFTATISVNPDSWVMSFIIALSSTKIEGIMASSDSINTKLFVLFIDDVWASLKDEEDESLLP